MTRRRLGMCGLVAGLILYQAPCSDAAEEEATKKVFVADGVVDTTLTFVTGGKVAERDGQAVISGVDTHLVTRVGLGTGDCRIDARLEIHGLDRSAAAIKFAHISSFGFEGNHNKMYITGPLFGGARGKAIGDPAGFLKDGRAFDLAVVRKNGTLTISIDGKAAYEQQNVQGELGCLSLTGRRATMLVRDFSAEGTFVPVDVTNISPHGIALHPEVTWRPTLKLGPFVRRADGGIVTVDSRSALVSHDNGKTWKTLWSFPADEKKAFSGERALIRTRDDVLVCVFLNQALRVWGWDSKTHMPIPKARSDVWCIRSVDGGRTWTDATMLYGESYSGCIRGLTEAENGNLIASVQGFRPELLRHATMPYVSTDSGQSWRRAGALLDLPGRGHHDGVIEGTVITLKDGRVWNLLRTSYDELYSSYSADSGLTWTDVQPSGIDASDGPPVLGRLSDGRLVLLWNRLYPEGQTSFTRKGGGERTLKQVSTHREELSLALSNDEGRTWTEPVVLARQKNARVAYPYVFEPHPGELWVTTMQGGLKIHVTIADVIPADAPTRPMKEWPW